MLLGSYENILPGCTYQTLLQSLLQLMIEKTNLKIQNEQRNIEGWLIVERINEYVKWKESV